MKHLIRFVSFIGLFLMFQLAYAVDLFQTGETLTADKLNDIDQRIMALEKTHVIGDTGPAGGWIFYVTADGLHGLEAAPTDQVSAIWGCFGIAISGASSIAIGAGARNTDDIIRGCPAAGIAAAVADEYISPSGYIDWYLPAQDELNEMYLNIGPGSTTIGNVGGFASVGYWSSSENTNGALAWIQDFLGGGQIVGNKGNPFGVRAIRAF